MDETDYYSMAWNRLVKPGVDQAMQGFQAQKLALEQQIAQANERASQQAQSYVDTVINSAMQRVQQRYQPEIQSLQEQIQGLQDYKAGKVDSVRVRSGFGDRMQTLEPSGVPRDSEYVDDRLRKITGYLQRLPERIRDEAFYEVDASQFGGRLGGNEQAVRTELLSTALPQAQNYLVRPIMGQLEQLNETFSSSINQLHNAGDVRASQAVGELYNFLGRRTNEAESEINRLRQAGELTPEREQAIRNALVAEGNFLIGPANTFTPEAYDQARNVYQQTYTQALQNIPQTAPVTTPTAEPTPQVAAPVTQQPTAPLAAPVTQQAAPLAAPVTQQAAPLTAPVTQVTAPLAAPVTQPTAPLAQPSATQPVAQPAPSFLGGIPVGLGQPTATPSVQPTGTTMATTTLNPENLPALRASGGGGASAIDPTLRPYLELGLRAAEQQFLQNVPQFFPGQTYVSPSQQTLDALAAQEQLARQAPTTLQAAQESYMRGLGGLGATAGGAFLSGNPYQQQMIQAATRPIMQQFEEQTLPGIASGFSQAGRYGSGAMERALGRATESTARAIGDVSTNIAYQDYGAERGRQQQAILGQITAAGQAPQIYGQQFLPSQQLAQIGAAREAIAGLPLQEQMQRFQFAQQAPRESLQSFLSSVYGTPLAGSQYAPQQQAQTNRAGNVLGGLTTGAGIGYMLGGTTGAGYGAALGGLGGLLL